MRAAEALGWDVPECPSLLDHQVSCSKGAALPTPCMDPAIAIRLARSERGGREAGGSRDLWEGLSSSPQWRWERIGGQRELRWTEGLQEQRDWGLVGLGLQG